MCDPARWWTDVLISFHASVGLHLYSIDHRLASSNLNSPRLLGCCLAAVQIRRGQREIYAKKAGFCEIVNHKVSIIFPNL